ncbi:hypothetical protein WISP_132904 [Willisornis vidua]|uniref:Uncharacterized protein n=1 Tax=Willisornis vidua TaxID=1566151 RepID=A0ABQ9CP97_9PASS|nr:hypothetical protein WISP_132904 [Willisornis vidua]
MLVGSQMEMNNSADTKVSGEAERGAASDAGAEVPLQVLDEAAVTLQSMEVHGGAEIHLQPMEDPILEQKLFSFIVKTIELSPLQLHHKSSVLNQNCTQEICVLNLFFIEAEDRRSESYATPQKEKTE